MKTYHIPQTSSMQINNMTNLMADSEPKTMVIQDSGQQLGSMLYVI